MRTRVMGTNRFVIAVTAMMVATAFLVVTSPVAPVGAETAAAPVGGGRALAAKIDSGPEHTCAILDDGGVRCWGRGAYGRLGYGSSNDVGDDELPGSLGAVYLGAGRTATNITVGGQFTCAILDNGSVRCWGRNDEGQLGYGNTVNIGDNELPGSVGPVDLGVGRTATGISAGFAHVCAILDDGSVRCWGYAQAGALGYGIPLNIGDDETPGSAGPVDLGPGRTATTLAAGGNHTCVILDNGAVRCWGYGAEGSLGYGNTLTIGDFEPATAAGYVFLGAGRTAKALTGGQSHTCAILDTGDVRCWGQGANGRLGTGNTASIGDDETPGSMPVVDITPPPVFNSFGGLTQSTSARPTGLSIFDLDAVSIAGGFEHTCVGTSAGTVSCWGPGENGGLGRGNLNDIGDNERPAAAGTTIVETGQSVAMVTAGYRMSCAVLTNGRVKCWGEGATGKLGNGNVADIGDNEPVQSSSVIDLGGVVGVSLGFASAPTAEATPTGVTVRWVVAPSTPGPTGIVVRLSGGQSVSLPASATSTTFTGLPPGLSVSARVELLGPATVSALAPTVVPGANAFVPLPPLRILDTRSGLGAAKGRIAAGGEVALGVLGQAGIPQTGVAAVVLNVTATEAGGSGFVTAYPVGIARPEASSLNLETSGQTIPNLVTVGVGTGGVVKLYTEGATHLLADVAGYYTVAPQPQTAGRLQPLDPYRLLDTRPSGPVGAGTARELVVTDAGGVPAAGVAAVVLNVTVTDADDAGYITVFPTGTARPEASNLNYGRRQTIPNQVIVPVGANGRISIFASATTNVIVDVAGWFTDASASPAWTGLFVPVAPTRTVDTRQSGKVSARQTISVPVDGRGGIPTGSGLASAVAMNVTATEATAAGYVTAYPTDASRPEASNLNLERVGQTIPNHVIVRVGKAGTVTLFSESGTHLLTDLTGWYLGGEI